MVTGGGGVGKNKIIPVTSLFISNSLFMWIMLYRMQINTMLALFFIK